MQAKKACSTLLSRDRGESTVGADFSRLEGRQGFAEARVNLED
jgi:hypothetical protein